MGLMWPDPSHQHSVPGRAPHVVHKLIQLELTTKPQSVLSSTPKTPRSVRTLVMGANAVHSVTSSTTDPDTGPIVIRARDSNRLPRHLTSPERPVTNFNALHMRTRSKWDLFAQITISQLCSEEPVQSLHAPVRYKRCSDFPTTYKATEPWYSLVQASVKVYRRTSSSSSREERTSAILSF